MDGTSLRAERLNQQHTLADGRRLGFAEFGAPAGTPVFYFHGWPSSRFEASLIDRVCAELHLRLIAPDRPGYGLSDAKRRRTLLDWPADVRQLADHLDLTRFAVLGVSGGGPYAAVCAARLPERVSRAVLVSSVAPLDRPDATQGMVPLNRWLLALGRWAPLWLAEALGAFALRLLWGKGHQVIPESIRSRLPPADQAALASDELRFGLIAASTEALRNGVHGAASDGLLYARPWGFSLAEVRVPMWLWHGEVDNVVPVSMGRYLARQIPDRQAMFFPEDGHFSLPFQRTREILDCLRQC